MAFLVGGCGHGGPIQIPTNLREGDVLFQSLPHNPLVDAIEGTTHSPFSHCGIAHQTPQGWMVIEAIEPVKETPLAAWVGQSRDGRTTVFHLKAAYRDRVPAFIAAARTYLGRPYDLRYDFDDEKIYCSELVYKAFRQAYGEELGRVQKLGELDWRPWQRVIESIEGGPVPLARAMITPRGVGGEPARGRLTALTNASGQTATTPPALRG